MEGALPKVSEDLLSNFESFFSFDRVLLAVSGGSDSLALLYLASLWAQRNLENAPQIEVATIDHGLRVGSFEEATRVKEQAELLGLRHHIIEWSGPKPKTSLQALARAERYALLEQLAQTWKNEKIAVATAHTLEDQAETVLMRLARGSGPDGLQGITKARALHASSPVTLLRPLLGVSRADLRTWLTNQNISWEEDPSNRDTRFERVRIRNAQPTLHSIGLHAEKLALSARRQVRAVEALEEATSILQKECLRFFGGAYGSLDVTVFREAPEELRLRLLTRLLNIFRGETPPAELEQVERLIEDLQNHSSVRRTLGGCEIHAKKKTILIYREVGRASLPTIALQPGVPVVWDQRFRILLARSFAENDLFSQAPPLFVRPLDPANCEVRREKYFAEVKIPLRAAATLPAVWQGEKLIKICGTGCDEALYKDAFPLTDPTIHAEFLHRFENRREGSSSNSGIPRNL